MSDDCYTHLFIVEVLRVCVGGGYTVVKVKECYVSERRTACQYKATTHLSAQMFLDRTIQYIPKNNVTDWLSYITCCFD